MCESRRLWRNILKEFEFTAEGEPDIEELKRKMLGDSSDPRSVNYVRRLIRPRINWFSYIFNVLVPPFVCAALIFVAVKYFDIKLWPALIVGITLLLGYILLRAKSFLIGIVKLYQRFAPASLRNKCRFEPSCSQYMVLSIQKYGAFKGLKKGVGRICRCNVKHGGFDYP